MTLRILRSLIYVSLLLIAGTDVVESRKTGHHRLHRHHHVKRNDNVPLVAPRAIPQVEKHEVLSDGNEIEQDLAKLPSEVLGFIDAIELRLHRLEELLERLFGQSHPSHPHPTLATPSTQIASVPTSLSPSHPQTVGPAICCGPGCPPSECPDSESSSASSGSSSMVQSTRTITITALTTVTAVIESSSSVSTAPPDDTWKSPYITPTPSPSAKSSAVTISVQLRTAPSVSARAANSSATSSVQPMYTFNAAAPDNVAVYYGETPDTQANGLLELCQDVNVDIAILAFIFDFFGPGGYPSIYFGPSCGAPNSAQASIAPGLANCSMLASQISACQTLGKKVLVSLGGWNANSSFTSASQAQSFAQTLWSLFGGDLSTSSDLRPFGPGVKIDGFDIDNEHHDPDYYDSFAYALRTLYATDNSKTYYLSAAPQCPIPDASIPMSAMMVSDFVWVQFYNNPACNLDSSGFQAAFAYWSGNLSESTSAQKPRLYIGAGAFSDAGSGYVSGSLLSERISLARELDVPNLGGMMLWDGSEALANVDAYDVNYIQYAKSALEL